MHKFLTWKVYLWSIYALAALFALSITYLAFFTSIWSGVDGGLGLVAALCYLFCLIAFIAFSHILHLWLRRHPVVLRRYLIVFWITVCISLVALAVTIGMTNRQSNNQMSIIDALQECTIKQVSWSYQPALLTITYTDKDDFRLAEWSDPTFLNSEVKKNKARCKSDYNFFINDRLTN